MQQNPLIPKHLAVIMDGNGRWAERQGRPRVFGHVRGCSRVREIIRESDRLGIQFLTLFAFSTENWGRPELEVAVLMRLLQKWLLRQQREIMEKNIRFRAIGSIDQLPKSIQILVYQTQEMSKENTGLQVTLALSYGGREEILNAAKRLAVKVKDGSIEVSQISEIDFANELMTSEIGDPDLLIRTSGEVRISNFLLWQLAYTELYFTEVMWPDFNVNYFHKALQSYTARQRRFGLTKAKVQSQFGTNYGGVSAD